MTIFILRHGQAEQQITTDAARELTSKGSADTKTVISRRLKHLQSATQLWSSPLVRAQQTAQIVVDLLPQLTIKTSDLIVPEGDPVEVMNWLQRVTKEHQSILIASHQPLVGELVNTLCCRPEGFHPMGTSSLAAINAPIVSANMGELLWLDHS